MSKKSRIKRVETKTVATVAKAEAKVSTNWVEAHDVKVRYYGADGPKLNKEMTAVAFLYIVSLLGLAKVVAGMKWAGNIIAAFAHLTAGYCNGMKAVTKDARSSGNNVYLSGAAKGWHGGTGHNGEWFRKARAKLAVGDDKAKAHFQLAFAAICQYAKLDMAKAKRDLLAGIAESRKHGNDKDGFYTIVQKAVGG